MGEGRGEAWVMASQLKGRAGPVARFHAATTDGRRHLWRGVSGEGRAGRVSGPEGGGFT
jgi:hypothetical protein